MQTQEQRITVRHHPQTGTIEIVKKRFNGYMSITLPQKEIPRLCELLLDSFLMTHGDGIDTPDYSPAWQAWQACRELAKVGDK